MNPRVKTRKERLRPADVRHGTGPLVTKASIGENAGRAG